jgi:hypothetical protein
MPSLLNRLATLLFLGLAASVGLARPQGDAIRPAAASQSDGPYVLWEGKTARVLSVRDGKRQESKLQAPYDMELPGGTTLRLDPAAPAPAAEDFPLPERIAAVSDVHGNLDGLVALLRAHGIIDARNAWTFGSGHLVVGGDVFDRGGRVLEVFWLLRQLEVQALRAGGRVHVLLGNHEVMALRGDVRYLNPRYTHLQKEVLGLDQQALYGPTSELGRWLRSRSALLRIGPFLFIHGGPSPDWLPELKNLPAFNQAFRWAIDAEGKPRLLGSDSPIWYRGLIPGAEKKRGDASEEDISRILATFSVRALVIGHTTQKQGITAYHEGRVHAIDADLQSGADGELWLFHKGTCFGGRKDGSRVALPMGGALR